jgi:hypothetical protein
MSSTIILFFSHLVFQCLAVDLWVLDGDDIDQRHVAVGKHQVQKLQQRRSDFRHTEQLLEDKVQLRV